MTEPTEGVRGRGMSDIEFECRYELATAYALWAIQHGPWPINYIAYMRAIGLLYW